MAFFKNKRILITGGAGAIGTNLAKNLLDTEAENILLLDDLSSSQRWNIPTAPRLNFIEGSILDPQKLDKAFSLKPHFVFHLAALFANQNSIDHPEKDLLTNGMGTLKVLQHAYQTGVERLVYSSSGCSVYSHDTPLPFVEEDVSINLKTPYQVTKLLGEMYCNFFSSYYDFDTVRIRLFNSYGPGEIPGQYRNVIPNFIYWALQGKALPIIGTGEETREFTYVDDIVKGLITACREKQAQYKVFNISGGREVTIRQVAESINELTSNQAGIRSIKHRKWDPKKRVSASIEKAKTCLGYSPDISFEVGLSKTVQWMQENWRQIQKDATFPLNT